MLSVQSGAAVSNWPAGLHERRVQGRWNVRHPDARADGEPHLLARGIAESLAVGKSVQPADQQSIIVSE